MISKILSRFVLVVIGIAIFIQYRLVSIGVSPSVLIVPSLPIFPTTTTTTNNNNNDNNNNIGNIGHFTNKVEIIGQNDLIGPECLVTTTSPITNKDVMFASLADGRIVRIEHDNDQNPIWIPIVRTGPSIPLEDNTICGKGGPGDTTNTESICGRPLGIIVVKRSTVDPTYNNNNNNEDKDEDVLVVADSYMGLLMVTNIYGSNDNINTNNNNTRKSQVHILATKANTDSKEYKFQLLNALIQVPDDDDHDHDHDDESIIYITETTTKFQRRRIFYGIFDGKPTGRLLKYTKKNGIEVVVDNLLMTNGITLSHDKQHLLIVTGVQIISYSLKTNTINTSEPFVDVMPGTGDNIKTFTKLPNGKIQNCYWAGYGSKYSKPFSLLKATANKPIIKAILCSFVPYKIIVEFIPKLSALGIYDENGILLDIYQDTTNIAPWLSEGEIFNDYIYLGSWYNPYLARVEINELLN